MNKIISPAWLLLVVSLPTASATARMRIWRALKALGCMALRDGAYLLPAGAAGEEALQDLANQCVREAGNAWLMTVQPRADDEAAAYRMLFDRAQDYDELRKNWKSANRTLALLDAAELARLRRKLQREFVTVATPFGEITVKIGKLNGDIIQAAPEFESCRAAAEKSGAPLKSVYETALLSLYQNR